MTAQAGTEIQTEPFTVIRTFNAPRDLVWQAFADGERLGQWWGPKGFSNSFEVFEFPFWPYRKQMSIWMQQQQ